MTTTTREHYTTFTPDMATQGAQVNITVPIREEQEIDIAMIQVCVPVSYGTEDIPDDFPHRKGDLWDITIDVDTGRVLQWPPDFPAFRVHMKVTDGGTYRLINRNGKAVLTIEQDYVPGFVPGEYGDYVIMTIGDGGKIAEWNRDRFARKVIEHFRDKADHV